MSRLIRWCLLIVGDLAYAINDRGPKNDPPYRWAPLEAFTDFCYRHARGMGAKMEWR